ncbi:glycosyltransferase family 2 protein [Pleurocapsales cyanobacterium LEGE 06147]|nr:glycosyltransferase family 2 protein [Pleurocapsales cyanobacterium LEGE 06147]
MSPIVSVIIPAYNTEAYLAQAIESALSQTLSEIEVIVVDDASTDNTVKVARSFSDPRLKLVQNSKNLGAGGARNRALREARGQWVAVLDSDDWYASRRLKKLVRVAEEQNADLVADDLYLIEDGQSNPWGTLIGESNEQIDSLKQIEVVDFVNSDIEGKSGLRLGFSKPLFRREFLVRYKIEYDETIKVSQDFWLNMDCFLHGATFFLVPEPYYFYRSRPGSLVSSNKIRRLEDECRAITNFLQHKDYLNDKPQLLAALLEKKAATKKWRDYYCIVEPLKQGKLLTAVKGMVNYPYFWLHFASELPVIIARRFQSWLGDSEVNIQKNMFRSRTKRQITH